MLYAMPAHAVRDMHHVSNYPSITEEPGTIWFDWARCLVPRAKSINYKESCNIFRQPG